ncbi:regulator of chromosome condensation isoform X7 [Ovis aries]|uniref:regulator of chromosome condensation isoform X7 n=1 Tax=Ovis aries TaxID=9940 RepID=UPI001C2EA328|nr:regulator of chromosome condensation isoform X7 [Ovis aries]
MWSLPGPGIEPVSPALDRKMPPKRVAKRRSPPEDALPKSKKVKDPRNQAVRAVASRRVPGARSCQGACGLCPPDQKARPVSHRSHGTEPGMVLTLGQGDVGQLGLGENVMERKKPALVSIPEDIVQAEAGGMHTVCLSKSGQDNNGVIGLLEPMKKSMVPVQVQLSMPVMKVASGNDHLVMLTVDGDLYTLGSGEQGQLGRVPELFANRGGRQGLERLLVPKCVMLKSRGSRGHVRFQDAFCGAYFTFAISSEGHVYGFGLSNYHQLGTQGTESCFIPQNLTSFKNSTKSWVGFSGGQHHTVCMDSEGKAYSLGRAEYGRLGLGEGAEEKSVPTLISRLPTVSSVACGASVGYAVTKDGRVFAWGMGTNYQLGTGQDEDAWSPVEMTGKQLENRVVLTVSSGGQHTVLLVKDKEQSW